MEKKPTQNTIIDHINKANKAKTFYKVSGSRNNIKIGNAPNYWREHPDYIYLTGVHIVGTYEDLFKTLTDLNFESVSVQNTIAMQGVTVQNYNTEKAVMYNDAKSAEEQMPKTKAKSVAQTRMEDRNILNKIDSFTMFVKTVRDSNEKVKGGPVKIAGTTTGTGVGRGQRAVAVALDQRVREAAEKGKVVNVSRMLEPGMVMNGNMILRKNFKLADIPGPKSRKLRWVQGLNIASDNPVAYKQAATILGRPDFGSRYEQAYGVQAVMSPALTVAIGQQPTALGFAPSVMPGIMTQPTAVFQPTLPQAFPQPTLPQASVMPQVFPQPTLPQASVMPQVFPQPTLPQASVMPQAFPQPTLPQASVMPQPLPQPSLSPPRTSPLPQPTLPQAIVMPQPIPPPSLSPRTSPLPQPTLPQQFLPQTSVMSQPLPPPSLSPRTSPLPSASQLPPPSMSPSRVVGGLPPVQRSPTGSPSVRISPRSAGLGTQMPALGSPRSGSL